jgi:D-alanyl-lipoteichoic acid acyltransferase DltB (MBOAT superfamily)
MSYTIDVYRRQAEPTKDLVAFATFVAFFPQLVAGPIERFGRLFPQLRGPTPARAAFARQGVFLILQGYVKKVAIADNIAPIVGRVFAHPGAYNAGEVFEAAVLFTAQIYCDFSGYTDIARGVAFLLGIELAVNFRAPLLSRSITEFWRRWHISLSGWLRDYLYIPLGGNRRGPARTYVNLLVTMLLGGLWHGASWKFVVWGGLHGAMLALERACGWGTPDTAPSGSPIQLAIGFARTLACFLAVVLAFVFFRATSVESAVGMIGIVLSADGLASLFTWRLGFVLAAILALDLPVLRTDRQSWILDVPAALRIGAYVVMALAVLTLSADRQQTFIYFAF